jgi:hypothetical protein
MATERVIHAIEPIGDGDGRVDPAEIDSQDITISVSQRFGSPNNQGARSERTDRLNTDVIESHVEIREPVDQAPQYDAVVVVVAAPVPDGFDPEDPLTIDISVDQVRQAEAAACPRCGNDLRETFDEGGCSTCGFHFDGGHLSDNRRAELNRRHDEYDDPHR